MEGHPIDMMPEFSFSSLFYDGVSQNHFTKVPAGQDNNKSVDRDGYVDCTSDYFNAVHTLKEEQLICDPSFTLLDSISAFEIMDPKMDTGIEYSETNVDVAKSLNPVETLAIMDGIFTAESDWHYGIPMSESILCSKHVFYICKTPTSRIKDMGFSRKKLDTLTDLVLFPYVLGVIKCCDYVRREFLTGNMYDEEDMSSFSYQLSLLEVYPAEKVYDLLLEGIQYLENEIKKDSGPCNILINLRKRLQLRVSLLHIYERNSIQKIHESLDNISHYTPELLDELQLVTDNVREDIIMQFWDSRVQAQLIVTAPPRNVPSCNLKAAYERLQYFAHDMNIVLRTQKPASPMSILSFCIDNTRSNRVPEPYVRSSLQTFLLAGGGVCMIYNPISFFLLCAHQFSCLPSSFYDPESMCLMPERLSIEIQAELESFVSHFAGFLLDFVRISTHNPCRFRRNLINLLPDCVIAHLQAKTIDEKLSSLASMDEVVVGYFSDFALHLKFVIIELILTTSFEQDLHKPHQWPYLFSYLNSVFELHLQHLQRILGRAKPENLNYKFINYLNDELKAKKSVYFGYFLLSLVLLKYGVFTCPLFSKEEKVILSNFKAHFNPLVKLSEMKSISISQLNKNIQYYQSLSKEGLLEQTLQSFEESKKSLLKVLKSPVENCQRELSFDLQTNYLKDLMCCCIANIATLQAFYQNPQKQVKFENIYGKPLPSLVMH
ncbi:NatC N-acetyltransferase complex subunit Mak10 [Schizosaccharomyces cryophilus OY26]|uniref:NatC N-acetyltransferase complex subunit Mak10 n=1 Tax=Schizosaccharomyces cryophilus (strain OY26 / ATCC MYA-4695 / CBS 11777 / NBRC 106824 / NRRL Y48691) TaxID=653667 RepID=S9X8M5_SCHCR|nr:NatC N-acetyltransferase complex subunit Mak10 [Schizosaccharomyces cryophilus OY26]EPY53497.1 NatC N-acetyltransferase complex subunit Mak10 [Schizosaccharomyces cryophilus OY26]